MRGQEPGGFSQQILSLGLSSAAAENRRVILGQYWVVDFSLLSETETKNPTNIRPRARPRPALEAHGPEQAAANSGGFHRTPAKKWRTAARGMNLQYLTCRTSKHAIHAFVDATVAHPGVGLDERSHRHCSRSVFSLGRGIGGRTPVMLRDRHATL